MLTWHCEATIADEPSDWPTLVIHELVDSPEPGTKANPIAIGDELAPLGSDSNAIVIHVDEDCGRDKAEQLDSDADTEIMATSEFWENLMDECFPVPTDEGAAVGSTSVLTPTSLLGCEDLEEPQILGQSSANHLHLDEKALTMAGGTFHVGDCHSFENTPCENGAKSERGEVIEDEGL